MRKEALHTGGRIRSAATRRRSALWAAVGGATLLVAGAVVATTGVAAANPPSGGGTVVANQGAAGTAPWPVSVSAPLPPLAAGTNTIGNVGIAGSLPAGTNDLGTVHIAPPTPYQVSRHLTDPTAANVSTTVSAPSDSVGAQIDTVSFSVQLPTGEAPIGCQLDTNVPFFFPLTKEGSNGTDDFYSGIASVSIHVAPGSSVTVICGRVSDTGSVTLQWYVDFTASGFETSY